MTDWIGYLECDDGASCSVKGSESITTHVPAFHHGLNGYNMAIY